MSIFDDFRQSIGNIERNAQDTLKQAQFQRALLDSVDPGEPPPPDPDPDPDPPPPVPPSDIDAILRGRFHVWRENHAANALGVPSAIVFARHGVVGNTIRTYTLNQADDDPQPAPSWFRGWAQEARDEGCIGTAIDLESVFLSMGPGYAVDVSRECRAVMPFLWVPVMNHRGSSYHIGGRWGMPVHKQAGFFNQSCDGCLFWKYDLDAAEWLNAEKVQRDNGLTIPFYNLSDFKVRGDHTPLTPADVRTLHRAGKSCGGFLSGSNNYDKESMATATGRTVKELYG